MAKGRDGRRRRADGRHSRDQILAYLAAYLDQHGRPPTYAEIGRQVDMKPSSVSYHLHVLERAGLLEITPTISRGIAITAKGRAAGGTS